MSRKLVNTQSIQQDFKASIVVFLVALPLCLGISQAIGVSVLSGLLSGIIGGLIVTFISHSSLSISGPAAGLVTIIIAAIATLGSYTAVLTALVLAGIFQIIMGLLGIGRFSNLIPVSVIRGMLAGIGLILIFNQLPIALGYISGNGLFQGISYGSSFISILSLLVLVLWEQKFILRRSFNRIPAPLIVVFIGIIVVFISSLTPSLTIPSSQLINISPFNLSEMLTPDWSVLTQVSTYTIALSLAIVASLESLLSLEATSKIDPKRAPAVPDRELIAQGAGNLLCGLVGGLPVTAVIVRSSANIYAGAKTKLSSYLHSGWLVLSLLFLYPLLNYIPLASLASILLYTGYKLASPRLFRIQWSQGLDQFISFGLTIASIIIFGMLEGIVIGAIIQLVLSTIKAEKNMLKLSHYDDVYVLKFNKNLTFFSKPNLNKILLDIPNDTKLHIYMDDFSYIEPDLYESLKEFIELSSERNIEIIMHPILRSQLNNMLTPSSNH